MKIATDRQNVSPAMELTLDPKVEAILRRKRAADFELYYSIGD